MSISPFDFAAAPHIHFGVGARHRLVELIGRFGTRVLLVTGGASFDCSSSGRQLLAELASAFELRRRRITGEPSPTVVDEAVALFADEGIDVVVAIGGGSCMDAGKAIAGLLPSGDSVMAYLEGVGAGKPFAGRVTPFIAVPTTAGTGSESSKNAVLSVQGGDGFKKSFRHESLVARHVVLDPELTLGCPPSVTAACGMDALTQLLESYLSRRASPMSDALAVCGLRAALRALPKVVADGDDLEARGAMLLAASLSGLTLANAGLGSVHALASPIGAFFPMPHGEVCGSLLYDATRLNIAWLSERDAAAPALKKYAEVGRMLSGESIGDEAARQLLLATLAEWSDRFGMPKLSDYGVTESDIPRLIDHASPGSLETNPVRMSREDLAHLIQTRL